MADKENYLPIEIQHELIGPKERELLGEALLNATVNGHASFTTVMLTLMGFTIAGKITTAQAAVLKDMAELLFTNICAQGIKEERAGGVGGNEDPLVAQLKAAQAKAKKVRPNMLLDEGGADEYGIEVLDAKGQPIPILGRKLGE